MLDLRIQSYIGIDIKAIQFLISTPCVLLVRIKTAWYGDWISLIPTPFENFIGLNTAHLEATGET